MIFSDENFFPFFLRFFSSNFYNSFWYYWMFYHSFMRMHFHALFSFTCLLILMTTFVNAANFMPLHSMICSSNWNVCIDSCWCVVWRTFMSIWSVDSQQFFSVSLPHSLFPYDKCYCVRKATHWQHRKKPIPVV